MLTLEQKALIYRDMITLGCGREAMIGYHIFGRAREGSYGETNPEEVTAFYMEMLDRVQVSVVRVREIIQSEVEDFKGTQEFILEEENDNDERT